MTRLGRTFASLITVVALVGTPSVLSACVALCVPGMDADAATPGTQATPIAEAHPSADQLARRSVHAHHAMSAVEQRGSGVADRVAFAKPTADARASATRHDCCADGLVSFAASVMPGRGNKHRLNATDVASHAPWFNVRTPALVVLLQRPTATSPSPPRSLAVLRI